MRMSFTDTSTRDIVNKTAGTNSQEGTALAGYPASAMVAFAVDAKGRPIFSFSSISTHKQVCTGLCRCGGLLDENPANSRPYSTLIHDRT
jgi:hypothetical protein